MPTATVTSKGQITIPIQVRRALGLKAGIRIDFYEVANGEYAFRPKTGSIMEMRGCIPRLDYVPSIEDMDRAVLEHVADLDRRTRSDGAGASDGESA